MDLAGPVFQRFVGLVDMSSIQVYGNPSERALRQLRDKVGLLGRGVVRVQPLHAGLIRSA